MGMEMKLKWSQTSHVKADTINRFVPAPGGFTFGADKFNPVLDMVHREDLNPNYPRLDDIQGQVVKGCSRVGWAAPEAQQPRRTLLVKPLPAEMSEASLNKLISKYAYFLIRSWKCHRPVIMGIQHFPFL